MTSQGAPSSVPSMRVRSTIVALAVAGVVAAHQSALAQENSARPARAPERSIAAAVAQRNTDTEVTIAGRAVVSSGKLQSSAFDVAIEDGSGGIRVFSRTPQPDVHIGDSLIATGAIKSYRGNLELAATNISIVTGAPRRAPLPVRLPIDPVVISKHAGRLVRVHGKVAGHGHSEGGQWLRLRDASPESHGTVTVWVPANHGAPIDLSRAGTADSIDVTGIATSYQDNAEDPVVWQIVPRDKTDIIVDDVPAGYPQWPLWAALGIATVIGGTLGISRLGARRQLHALRETEARYTQLLALLPDAVIVHARGFILFANPAASKLLEIPDGKDLVGRPLANFIHHDSQSTFLEDDMERVIPKVEDPARTRARMQTAARSVVDVEVATSPCVYHDRPAMLLLARDITGQLRYERDLHALALVDELTGLQNRRAFTLFAEQELARARRHGRTPVLVFADLDGLKQINDQHGHAAGDAAIKLVAGALRSIFRETDLVARWSGDEFVALMVEGSEEAATLIGARLDAAIAVQSPPRLPYIVTASVGASPLDPALPLRDAMERADAELYAQKKRGRRSKIRATPMGVDVIKDDR